MKKILSLFAIMLLCITTVGAEEIIYDGIRYTILDDTTCEVGGTFSSPSNAKISETVYDVNGNPYTVVGIGDQAFYMSGISSVEIPASVTYIGYRAFYQCVITDVSIPGNVKTIGEQAFYQCRSLKSVSLEEGITSIGTGAFQTCVLLEELTIPSTVETLGINLCWSCDVMTSFTFLNKPTEIPEATFRSCKALETIEIPESVTTIGTYAFYYCLGLEEINIPETVTTLGPGAFGYCQNLTSVTIPESITSLPDQAFRYCRNLEEITIPATVSSIGAQALERCESLRSVTSLNPTPPSCEENTFYDGDSASSEGDPTDISSCTLYVPCESKDDYAEADIWSDFGTIEAINCTEEIGSFVCVVDPESGSTVKELYDNITFYNPTEGGEIYVNDYCADIIEVYAEEGLTFVTRQAQFYPGFGPNWEEYSQTVFFEDRVIDEGSYVVTVPAELFIIYDEEGKVYYNEAMTLTYTISADSGDQEPNYELVFYPEDLSTLDILSTISISCEDGITQVLMPEEEITITDPEGNVFENHYTITEVDNDLGIITEVIITLNPELVDAGTYYVNVPAGYFDIGNQMNEAFTITYTITGELAGISKVNINSEDVKVFYTTSGQQTSTSQRGVNIIRMKDGTTKKILIK